MSISLPLSYTNPNLSNDQSLKLDSSEISELPSFGRNPCALDVIYITSTEDFLKDISGNLKKKADKSNVPLEIFYVEELTGYDQKEKISDLKSRLKDLHESGKFDEKTQVIIHLHGSVSEGPHQLSNKKNNFLVNTGELVSLIRNSKTCFEKNVDSDIWAGTIHIGACGAGRASDALKDDLGMNLLYAGKNVKLGIDNEAIFSGIINHLGEYRKDIQKNSFPTIQQFYGAAGSISGGKISLSGQGSVCHIRSNFLPLPSEMVRQEVVDKLERSLAAKLVHGKPENVKKITDLLGPFLKNIKFCDPLLVLDASDVVETEKKLKILMEAGIDINKRFVHEDTALHVYAKKGKKQEALLLIKHGADINAKNRIGETPLSVAIGVGGVEIMECLISAGADIRAVDRHGNSALHVACDKGDKDLVERLLDKGASAFSENYIRQSALQNAISAKRLDIVDLILVKASQSDLSEGEDYDKALFYALSENKPHLLRKMIAKTPDKQNTLSNIFKFFEEEITENNESFQFDLSLFARHKVILKTLVRQILDSNDRMPDYFKGYLMSFLKSRYLEYLPAILASPNLGEKWSDDLEIIRDLFADMGEGAASNLFGAAITLKSTLSERIDRDLFQLYEVDAGGLTPFQSACRKGNIAELMILDNVDANLKFSEASDSKSALMLACEADSEEVVNWLLDNEVDRNHRDAMGKTVLDYAIKSGNPEIEQAVRTRQTFSPPIPLN